ncbi:MAG: ankyrin repeat domain-containing protein [Bdellovibrionaceae bacterium]|nr:ankyrin repeat domain-containing protein [Pseudobdellovibrionaceae bacterium]
MRKAWILFPLLWAQIAAAAGDNALIKAVHASNRASVERQLRQGAKINAADKEGYTALYYAVALGEDDISLLLIEKGADLRRTYGPRQENLLFEAGRLGRMKIIKAVLAKNPALARQKNTAGKTPADEAKTAAQSAAAELLKVK